MSLHSLVKNLRSELNETLEGISYSIASGRCSEFSEYRHQCGVIEGLSVALEILNNSLKKEEEFDDND